MFDAGRRQQLLGVALLALALFTALSLVPIDGGWSSAFPRGNIMGVVGAGFARYGFAIFGAGLLGVPVLLALGGAACFDWIENVRALRWGTFAAGLMILLPAFAALWAADTSIATRGLLPGELAGWLGVTIALPLLALLGWIGTLLVLIALCVALSTRMTPNAA